MTMARDQVFEGSVFKGSDFAFTREVADVFDDMLVRSVPFYLEQQAIIKDFAKRFYILGTKIYDLGSPTAPTLLNIAAELKDKTPSLVGFDNSMPMVEKARARIKETPIRRDGRHPARWHQRRAARVAELRHDVLDAPDHPTPAPRGVDPPHL